MISIDPFSVLYFSKQKCMLWSLYMYVGCSQSIFIMICNWNYVDHLDSLCFSRCSSISHVFRWLHKCVGNHFHSCREANIDILHTTKVILHCFVFEHVVITLNYMSFREIWLCWVDSDRFGWFHKSVGMSGDGSLLTHTCFLEKVLNLSQKIVSSPKYPSYPSPITPLVDFW